MAQELFHDLDFSDAHIYWFATDKDGEVGFFDTDGMGLLPLAWLNSSFPMLKVLDEFFCALGDICECRGDRSVAEYLQPNIDESRVAATWVYSQDAETMSRKGLYSWNAIPATNRRTGYFRSGIPSVPLKANSLPSHITAALNTCRFDLAFKDVNALMFEQVRFGAKCE